MLRSLCVTALVLGMTTLHGADIAGKWFAKVPRVADGTTVDTTFTFVVKGTALTGTVANKLPGLSATRRIQHGKIDGNTISFTTPNPRQGDQTFTGTLSGDQLKMTRTGRGGKTYEFVATRIK